jgi:N-acetylglucosamine-6-sulfatase
MLNLVSYFSVFVGAAAAPNIIFFLTDDQDLLLGSMQAMPKLNNLIATKGAIFENAYVNTPVCCPSRSSFLTGLYNHRTQVVGNSIPGNCYGPDFRNSTEPLSFANILHNQTNYATSYAGKYLNMYGFDANPDVPPGWTEWNGLVGNSQFYNYRLVHRAEGNSTVEVEKHGSNYYSDYLPDLVLNRTSDFIGRQLAAGTPFVSVLGFPCAHEPAVPAPQHVGKYAGAKAPRLPNWGVRNADSHWLESTMGAGYGLTPSSVVFLDVLFERRLETLLSVDDAVEAIYNQVAAAGQLDNTYFIYTSDHGYHLGSNGLAIDKRQAWETDTRIPLFVSGPGIKPNTVVTQPVSSTDIAPTILDMAGLSPTSAPALNMDGSSILGLATGSTKSWRHINLIEYHGESGDGSAGGDPACAQTAGSTVSCDIRNNFTQPPFIPFSPSYETWCTCQDTANNTYNCVRILNSTQNWQYCEYELENNFVEFYDIGSDPWQLVNLGGSMDPALKSELSGLLASAVACVGKDSCSSVLSSS